MKVGVNVKKMETIGFGRGDGGCSGAPFPELGLECRREDGDCAISAAFKSVSDGWVGYESYYIQSVGAVIFRY